MSTQQKLINLLSANLGIPTDTITAETTFADDLKMDSLDKFDLIIEVGEEFGFDPDTVDWGEIRTVGELVNIVNENLKAKA